MTIKNAEPIHCEDVFPPQQPVFIDGAEYKLTSKNEKDKMRIGTDSRYTYRRNVNRFIPIDEGLPDVPASDFGKVFTVELVTMGPEPVPFYERVKCALGDRSIGISTADHLIHQVTVDHRKASILDDIIKEFDIPDDGNVIDEFDIPDGEDIIKWLRKRQTSLYERVKCALGDRGVEIAGEDHLVGQVVVDHRRASILDNIIEEFDIPDGGDIIKWLRKRPTMPTAPTTPKTPAAPAPAAPASYDLAKLVGCNETSNMGEVCNKAIDKIKNDNLVLDKVIELNKICQKYNVGKWGSSAIDSAIGYIEFREKSDNTPEPRSTARNKYDREIVPFLFVDVYDVLSAFPTESPAIDHAVKKLLAPGQRGVKNRTTDLEEAISSIQREINRMSEWGE